MAEEHSKERQSSASPTTNDSNLRMRAIDLEPVREAKPVTPLRIAGYAAGSVMALALGWQIFCIQQGAGYFDQALSYLKAGQNDQAVACLNAYLNVEDDPRGYCLRGTAYARLGNDDKALLDFDRAVAGDLANSDGYAGRAAIRLKHNQYEQAVNECEHLIALKPNAPAGYLMRALAFNKLGKYKEAQEDANFALSLNSKLSDNERAQAYSARAYAEYKLKKYEQSLSDYKRAIQLSPKNATLFASRAVVYKQLADWKHALADCNDAMTLDPTVTSLYKLKALCAAGAGEEDRALADIDRAIKNTPGSIDLYRCRGDMRASSRDLKGAMDDYEYVLSIHPDDQDTRAKYESVRLKVQAPH